MNPADIPNIEAMLQLWMLGMIRPGAAFIAAPVFGATSVPVQLRLVIALAVAEWRLTSECAFAAAQVDELYQVDRWGDDPLAVKHRDGVAKDIDASARFLALLEQARLRG